MKVITGIEEISRKNESVAVALGNFDGVHLGHQTIIRHLVNKAKTVRMPSVVFTFNPHPLQVLGCSPMLLTLPEEKERLISQLNVDYFLKYPFNNDVANMTAEDFVLQILIKGLHARHIFVGYNFNFGKNALGNVDLLAKLCRREGCEVNIIPEINIDSITASSTNIRNYLMSGNIEQANRFLGYAYNISGKVVNGEQNGRSMGFPTANLKVSSEIVIPAGGVYAVKALIGQNWFDGVANIGCRPTLGTNLPQSIEVHLLDQDFDLYHQEVRLYFIKYLRAEKRFSALEALIAQINLDSRQAQDILAKISPREILLPTGDSPGK